MNLLTPAALALAVLLPIIIAMYLLKLRRTEQVVSSVYLWRRMVRDVEANAPWQRLRRNLLMFLQLLFLLALIIALAQPFTWAEGVAGQAAIFIIDNSASMAATDTPPNRLEAAKDQARRLVDGLPDDARVTVMSAGDSAQVLAASTQNRRQIYQAIESIELTTGSSNLAAALSLASAIASRQPDTDVIILSDGRAPLPDRLALHGRARYYPIGVSGDNQAISLLTLETSSSGSAATAFAQITNYGPETAARRMELYADGLLVNAYDLEVPPGGIQAIIADDLDAGTGYVEARLQGQDALHLDDRAWAVRQDTTPVSVRLVTEGNLFLFTALSLLPGMEIEVVHPGDFETGDYGAADVQTENGTGNASSALQEQLTIFDTYVPITATLPAGSLLFISPPRSTELFSVVGTLETPALRIVDTSDPLVSNLSLTEVNVLDAVRISLPPWARAVVAGDTPTQSGPMLMVGEVGGQRAAILAFDLRRSDLPLQIAFPLMMANLTSWLVPGRSGGLPEQVDPGAAISLALPPEVGSVTVTRPDGSRTQASIVEGRAVFADTHQLGIYHLTWENEGRLSFAVNLFSPQESNVSPALSLPVLESASGGDQERPQQARQEWWRPLAYAALVFLVIEWLVYQRAVLVKLWRRIRPPRPQEGFRSLR
jgi:Ca-activated chloride channel homolog